MATAWRDLRPVLHPDPYVFAPVPETPPGVSGTPGLFAVIREDEGVTLVISRDQADRLGLAYRFLAARITLTINSDLAALGLTAEISRVLAEAGISCNVIAGLAHDHLFVDAGRGLEALRLLQDL